MKKKLEKRARNAPVRTKLAAIPLVLIGCSLVWFGAPTPQDFAMGSPQSGSSNAPTLAANTITVEGMATEPVLNPITDISYSTNVTDTSMNAVLHDVANLEKHEKIALKRDGLPAGDVVFSSLSFNSGGSGPQGSVQMNVIVRNAAEVAAVMNTISRYQPGFLNNAYTNEQVLPLNPAAMWPSLYRKALMNARTQAQQLARDAGVGLGRVVSISTIPTQGTGQVITGPYPTSPSVVGMQMQYGMSGPLNEVSTQLLVSFAVTSKTTAN